MNIHEFRNTLIRVSYAIQTQRTYNALETHMKREFAGQLRRFRPHFNSLHHSAGEVGSDTA